MASHHRTEPRFCYVHAGAHKTGTSSIQAFLALNRLGLSAQGVLIPKAAAEPHGDVAAHHSIARELCGSPVDRGALAALSHELAASDAKAACVSSEDFSLLSRTPGALVAFRDAILSAGFVPQIVIFLRPQVSYCSRVYAENVRHGFRTPLRDYVQDVLETGTYFWNNDVGMSFDYNVMLDAFANIFGPEAIIARRYHPGASNEALLQAFARIILPDVAGSIDLDLPATRLNVTPPFATILRALSLDVAVDGGLRFAPFNLPTVARLAQRFQQSNSRLRSRYSVDLPACEPIDIIQALPVRASVARTRALHAARHSLNNALASAHVEKSEALLRFQAIQ